MMNDYIESIQTCFEEDTYRAVGHGSKYYRSQGAVQDEQFANLFQLWSENNHWKEAEKLFPNLTKEFSLLMKDNSK